MIAVLAGPPQYAFQAASLTIREQGAEKARPSFRGAPKARTRNPETQEIPTFWIPGPPLRGVPE
jgi:hypothetical protein